MRYSNVVLPVATKLGFAKAMEVIYPSCPTKEATCAFVLALTVEELVDAEVNVARESCVKIGEGADSVLICSPTLCVAEATETGVSDDVSEGDGVWDLRRERENLGFRVSTTRPGNFRFGGSSDDSAEGPTCRPRTTWARSMGRYPVTGGVGGSVAGHGCDAELRSVAAWLRKEAWEWRFVCSAVGVCIWIAVCGCRMAWLEPTVWNWECDVAKEDPSGLDCVAFAPIVAPPSASDQEGNSDI